MNVTSEWRGRCNDRNFNQFSLEIQKKRRFPITSIQIKKSFHEAIKSLDKAN